MGAVHAITLKNNFKIYNITQILTKGIYFSDKKTAVYIIMISGCWLEKSMYMFI